MCSGGLHQLTVGENHLTQNQFHNKVLNLMYFIEYCTDSEKQSWLYGYSMAVSVSIVYPHDRVGDWELWLPSVTRDGHNTYK